MYGMTTEEFYDMLAALSWRYPRLSGLLSDIGKRGKDNVWTLGPGPLWPKHVSPERLGTTEEGWPILGQTEMKVARAREAPPRLYELAGPVDISEARALRQAKPSHPVLADLIRRYPKEWDWSKLPKSERAWLESTRQFPVATLVSTAHEDPARTAAHEATHALRAAARPERYARAVRRMSTARSAVEGAVASGKIPRDRLKNIMLKLYRAHPEERAAFRAADTAVRALDRAVAKGLLVKFGKSYRRVAGTLKGAGALKLGGLPVLALLALGSYAAKRAGGTNDPREV